MSSEITYNYGKVRREFNRPVEFQVAEPETIVDIAPNDDIKNQFVCIDPNETEIQNVPLLSETQTNTKSIDRKSQGMMHEEGGWPSTIDPTEFEEKLKHCKKQEREDNYFYTCKRLLEGHMEKYLKQNNALDIYGSYFSDATQSAEVNLGPPSVKTTCVFKDPSPVKRTAVNLSWLFDGKKLAVAYCNLRFQANTEGASIASHIWDVNNPNDPVENLVPQSPLCCIEYYHKDQHLIAGGSYNGVMQYWDTRNAKRPAGRTAIEESHKEPIWDLKWLHSKQIEILTVATDGSAFVWDCRRPDKPTETITVRKNENDTLPLLPKSNEGGARGVLGGTCLDYDPNIGGPSKFMVGTEQGTVLTCNRKAVAGKSAADKITHTFNGHHGPVYSVQRNPSCGGAFAKYFLTVGDWTARLWCDDFKNYPMYSTYYHKAHLTYGCWSPVRTGVFFTTRMDGVLDVWDIVTRQSMPVLSVQVSDYALHTARATPEGSLLAIGSVDGTTTLLELSAALSTPTTLEEKAWIQKMFENEAQRDKNLAAQHKAKEKARENSRRAAAKGNRTDDATDGHVPLDEEELKQEANKYLHSVEIEEQKQNNDLEHLQAMRDKLKADIEDGLEIEQDDDPFKS